MSKRFPLAGTADDKAHRAALHELLALRACYRYSGYLFDAEMDEVKLALPVRVPFEELITRYGSLMAEAGYYSADSQKAQILALQLIRDIAFDEEARVEPNQGAISETPWLDILRLTAPILKEETEAQP